MFYSSHVHDIPAEGPHLVAPPSDLSPSARADRCARCGYGRPLPLAGRRCWPLADQSCRLIYE